MLSRQPSDPPAAKPSAGRQDRPPSTQPEAHAIDISLALPDWLGFRFRSAARQNQLASAFPSLRFWVDLPRPTTSESKQAETSTCVLRLTSLRPHQQKWRPKSQSNGGASSLEDTAAAAPDAAGDVNAQLDKFRRLLVELLKQPNFQISPSMTHTLVAKPSDFVQWYQVPDAVALIAAELDVVPPLFCLARPQDSSGEGVDDVAETLAHSNLGGGTLRHRQQYVPPLGSLDKECIQIAARIVDTFTSINDAYQRHDDPLARRFRLVGSVGCHLYGINNIQGQLAAALPSTDAAAAASPVHQAKAFPVRQVINSLRNNFIKSSFAESFPVSAKDSVIDAIRSLGFSHTHHIHKKVSFDFILDPDFVAAHFAQTGVPYVKALMFASQFKLAFVYDARKNEFVLSNKGLRYSIADRSVRHTWVDMVDVPSGGNNTVVPVMPRVRFGCAHAGYESEVWALAKGFVGTLTEYVRDNTETILRGDQNGEQHELKPLSVEFRRAVEVVRLEFVNAVVLARPSAASGQHAGANRHVSVKTLTKYYRVNNGSSAPGYAALADRASGQAIRFSNHVAEVPLAQPRLLSILVRDSGLTKVIDAAGCELGKQQEVLVARAVELTRDIHEVAAAVRDCFVVPKE